MNFSVRLIRPNDYQILCGWWQAVGEIPPRQPYLPEMSTFICEVDGVMLVSVSVYTLPAPTAWLDNFIGDPELSGPTRREATRFLFTHVQGFARDLNYERVFCMATNERLKSYYEKLGFTVTCDQVFTLIKDI